MKTTILLLLLLLHLTVQAAVPVGGVRINSDSTGTNTRSAAITVTLQTNLNSGVVNATNSVNVGQVGQTGVVNIGSTTTTNFFILTTTSTNALVSINATDDFDHAALTIIVTNEVSSADLLHLQNGTNVKVYIQYDGSILGRRLFAEASPASDDFTRIQPTDFKINSGTNTNYFEVHLSNGEINWLHEGTNAFRVVQDSGYGAGGIRVLTDQGGLYLNIADIGGGGGNLFNTGTPAASNVPRYTDTTGTNVAPSTVLIDAAGQLSSTNAWIFANGAAVATQTSTNTFTLSDLTAAGNTLPGQIGAACSDETTALTTGTNKVRFRMPYAMTVTAVRASLTTAQTAGSILTVDINEGGTSILSTKITIDDNETTSTTAATPPVISDTALADDAIITVDIDQVGTSPAGLKIWLIGTY